MPSASALHDYPTLARELLRALRGKRSQLALSRRLGYSTNAVYTWEAGLAWPTAARVFELATTIGVAVEAGLGRFFRNVPEGIDGTSLSTPSGIERLLTVLRGRTPISDVAEASGLSRYTLSRWLNGKAQPKLPEFLCYVDHTSLRLLDFVAILTDPSRLASTKDEWARLEAARQVGYEQPLSHAVLRGLELESYRRQTRHNPGYLARVLGINRQLEEECLVRLSACGQIRRNKQGLWEPCASEAVDFRRDPIAAQRVKTYWARFAAERTRRIRPGLFVYNVFAVSRADLKRLETLVRGTLQEMRSIIAQSQPSEVVALTNLQLFGLQD